MPQETPEFQFRKILLRLLDNLSENDCKKLKFLLGEDIPRRIQDDPTIGGTLDLFQQLFDQHKISDQNFTYLINAFESIECLDAARRLRKHQMKTVENVSISSTLPIVISRSQDERMTIGELCTDYDEDKYLSSRIIQCSTDDPLCILPENLSKKSSSSSNQTRSSTSNSPTTSLINNQTLKKKFAIRSQRILKNLRIIGVYSAILIVFTRYITIQRQNSLKSEQIRNIHNSSQDDNGLVASKSK